MMEQKNASNRTPANSFTGDNYPFKLTVIVPCYNVENYLATSLRCLERQWDDDSLEMVFINDCSTDGTINMLREFCERHPHNTQLIDKPENQGVSRARNDGLSVARGKWIVFLDPDDALKDGAYRYLYEHFITDDIQILSFKTNIIEKADGFEKILSEGKLEEYSADLIEWEGSGTEFFKKYLAKVCWIFFYSHQLIIDLGVKFRNLSYLEDNMFNMDLLLQDYPLRVRRVKCRCHYWIHHNYSLSNIRYSSAQKNSRMLSNIITGVAAMQQKKEETADKELKARIAWNQTDSLQSIAPLALRSDMSCKKISGMRKQLMAWKVYPYTGGAKGKIYDLFLHFPASLMVVRPLIKVFDRFAK